MHSYPGSPWKPQSSAAAGITEPCAGPGPACLAGKSPGRRLWQQVGAGRLGAFSGNPCAWAGRRGFVGVGHCWACPLSGPCCSWGLFSQPLGHQSVVHTRRRSCPVHSSTLSLESHLPKDVLEKRPGPSWPRSSSSGFLCETIFLECSLTARSRCVHVVRAGWTSFL